ncbi:MAG: alpha/beta hydrolase family protein [Segniliparus sp.]|uniref:alpha/beta hydrolase family protein n=1 Tax=Segniliparus sp. TaxID=2804064 RepID=UPI003F35F992
MGRVCGVVLLVLACVAAMIGCSKAQPRPEQAKPSGEAGGPLLGDWNGEIQTPSGPLAIGVALNKDGGFVDVPSQGLFAKPLGAVAAEPGDVRFAIPGLPGAPNFHGTYDPATGAIAGQFVQFGSAFPLVLRPGKAAGANRPQEPEPPYPYRAEEVAYPSGPITIAGTLTEPDSGGPFPAVILVNGSGRNDRNEDVFGHKPFLVLADALTRSGYAVLRVDKRGVGGTGGKLADSDYDDLVDDVGAGLAYLRGRGEIDKDRVGLLGHSEGGYLAPIVAARPQNRVAFVVMMAGPAVPGAEVLKAQDRLSVQSGGASGGKDGAELAFLDELLPLVKAGNRQAVVDFLHKRNQTLPENRTLPDAEIESYASPYFRALVSVDPAAALSALRMPVLAFYGGKDLQVPADQSEPVARRLLADDPDATVHVFPDHNHLMQQADTGRVDEYARIETTIDPVVLDYVTSWLVRRFPPKP